MPELPNNESGQLPSIKTVWLTEQYIKETFVPFLRDFYKYRYEYSPESLESSLDNVSDGGLVADGLVRFKKTDGKYFLSTFEASSRDKAAEVKYGLNTLYFIWDCIAFGSFGAALVYLWLFSLKFQWLVGLRWNGNLGLVLGLGMFGFFMWYYAMRNWKKYRYIYAIEQFKQYRADEQWVVLGEDVFPSPTDPYLLELKEQCIYNGIGLAVVSNTAPVRLIVSPSRIGEYGGNRQMVHWVTRTQWYTAISNNMNLVRSSTPKTPDMFGQLWQSVKKPVYSYLYEPLKKNLWALLSRPFGGANSVYERFMHGHPIQKWVLGISASIIVVAAYLVLSFRAEEFADPDSLRKWRPGDPNPEEESYALSADDEPVPYGSDIDREGIPKQYPGPRDKTDEGVSYDFSIKKTPPPEVKKPVATTPPADKSTTTDDAKKKALCSIIQDQEGYFIQDNIFATKVNAEARVGNLRNKGIVCRTIWQGCIDEGTNGYIVWIGGVFETQEAAQEKLTELTKTLEKDGLTQGKLSIRKIN